MVASAARSARASTCAIGGRNRKGNPMTSEELRDTLAQMFAQELIRQSLTKPRLSQNELVEQLSYAYPFADIVLSRRNVSEPKITKHD
jgi:arsenate reductase-like glutaredoxin family protein